MNYTGANPATKAIAIIPARYKSTRLPGKPLLPIVGRPLVLWVVERALAARHVARAIVATDDRRILEAVTHAGFEARMTGSDHASGTDRVAEVAHSLPDAEIIVNVQGDEPLISPQTIDRAIEALTETDTGKVEIATTCEPISDRADVSNPAVVKVVIDENGRALYFSRAPIPYQHEAVRRHGSLEAALENEEDLLACFRKHTGLYVYRRDFLLKYTSWPQSALERAEGLEQLRALEHGATIKVVAAASRSIGVDTIEDLERVRAIMESEVTMTAR
ncbi:MAG TPA: 3-deoxy-manno-octulosonate cytidylyltransferase [Pyrinomonadaceae bacterium]